MSGKDCIGDCQQWVARIALGIASIELEFLPQNCQDFNIDGDRLIETYNLSGISRNPKVRSGDSPFVFLCSTTFLANVAWSVYTYECLLFIDYKSACVMSYQSPFHTTAFKQESLALISAWFWKFINLTLCRRTAKVGLSEVPVISQICCPLLYSF